MLPVDLKMALLNYAQLKGNVRKIEDDVEVVNAKRFKIGGSIIKMPENGSKPRDLIIIENLEKLEKLKASHSVHHYLVELANEFIEALTDPYKSMVIDKYINRISNYELEQKYSYSVRQINRIVEKLIEKFIERG